MSRVVISSDGNVQPRDPCLDILKDAGFEPDLKLDRQFALGLMPELELIDNLQGAVGVLAWGEKYTPNVINSLPDLRAIARMGVGYDRVDIPAATAAGKVVTIAPNANYQAVAEHAIALIFALAKFIVPGDKAMRQGEWLNHPRLPLRGKTLGILGLGRIGKSVAERVASLKMTILATEMSPDKDFIKKSGIELVDLDTLLAHSDYVCLHLPLSDATRGIINKNTLAKMKPDAAIINTSRGGLIAEADLVDALRTGQIRAAGIDVFEQEPAPADNPLRELDNVILSPHIAGNDSQACIDMGNEAAQNIVDLSRGKWPEGAVVNKDVKDKFSW